jgi:cytochrome c oxidase assembly factor CtaG/putative copper export protein
MTVRQSGRNRASTSLRRTSVRATPARSHHRPAGVVPTAGLVAVAACALALVLTGGVPQPVPPGLPDAGVVTGWGLRLVSVLSMLAAVGTVGSLLVAGVLLPAGVDGRLVGRAQRALTVAGRWSAAWAALAVGELVLSASDIAGVPVTRVALEVVAEVAVSRPGAALCLTALVAGAVSLGARRARTGSWARVLLGLALVGLLPEAAGGHASATAGHDVLTSALVVHVVAVSLWTGGLLGLVLHLRACPADLPGAVARFSPLALASYLALAGSGVIAAVEHLGTSGEAWSTGYGALIATKAVVLLVLGLAGHLHRRTTIARLAATGDRRPFLRLAGAELVLMGVAIGLAAALSRTAAPVVAVVRSGHGEGHSTLPAVVEPLSATALATAWRPDAVVLVVLCAVATGYARCVGELRRRGRPWPLRRSSAFAAAILVALVALCSGVGTYAPAVLSVQVAQLLLLLLVVPCLLLVGAPARLARESGSARGATSASGRLGPVTATAVRAAASPVTGAAAACALLLVLYRSPLMELSQRSSWVHLAVLALALGSGLLLFWPALGDDVARPRGTEWSWCMVGVAACLAVLAAQLRYGDRLLAASWFLELRFGWIDPVADQRLAGGVVAAAAAAVLLVAVLSGTRRTAQGGGGGQRGPQPPGGHSRSNVRPSRSDAPTGP